MRKKLLGMLIICGIAFLAHLPAIRGTFHFDDFHHIVNNPSVKNFPGYFYFFSHPESFSVFGKSTLYRPLTLLSFALNHRFLGSSPERWLIFNILLHSLNAGLFFLLAQKWFLKTRPALLAGLLFSVMAIFSQPVNYLSNRSTLLAVAFILLGLIFHPAKKNSQPSWNFLRVLFSLVCFWFGLLSKELSIIFPLLVLIQELYLNQRFQRRFQIWVHLIYWLNLALFLLLRFHLFKTIGSNYYPRGFLENALIQAEVAFFYLIKFFFPIHLSILPAIDLSRALPIFCLILLSAFSLKVLFFWRDFPILASAWAWFLVSLVPSSLMPLNVLANEERIYLPGLGIILIMVWLIESGIKARGGISFLLFGIIFLSNILLLEFRIPVWRDEIGLWRDALRKAPRVSGAYVMYANALIQAQKLEQASSAYERALDYNPTNPQALAGMCQLALQKKEIERLKQFADAYARYAGHPYQRSEALSYQALAEFLNGNQLEAEKLAKQSLELIPSQAKALYVLSAVYHFRENWEDAEKFAHLALNADPDFANVYELLGLILIKQGKTEKAIPYLEKFTQLAPDQAEGWLNLGMAYWQMDRTQEAKNAIELSLKKKPDYALAFYGKALIEWTLGAQEQALSDLRSALKIDPENIQFHRTQLEMLLRYLEENPQDPIRQERIKEANKEIQWLKMHNQDTKEFQKKLKALSSR